MMLQSWTEKNRIHFWLYDLVQTRSELHMLKKMASDEEHARAEKMESRLRAETFLITRGLLRRHLAERLAVEPKSLQIEIDEKGKPALADGAISFSISHSHDRILIALDESGAPIGVDIQFQDPSVDFELLAKHLYSPEEQAELREAADSERKKLALKYWCLREALFKMGSASESESVSARIGDYAYAACFAKRGDRVVNS